MAGNKWPLEMAPISMLPNGFNQNVLADYLRLRGLSGESSQIPAAPPVWPVPQSSPDFNDPDNWLGNNRNALAPQGLDILALLSRKRGA